MDRNDNPGINPGNGPATWESGEKPMLHREVDTTVPQEFTSAAPSDQEGGSEAAGAGPLGTSGSPGTTSGPGPVSG